MWWFGLTDFSITIGEFGFLSVKDVKVRWKGDDPGLVCTLSSYLNFVLQFCALYRCHLDKDF